MLQVRLLGKIEISVSGTSLSLRGKSGLWLLGILTLHANRPVERDWLAGILWAESAPEQGRANLRRALTDVRHALGDAASRLSNPTQQTVALNVAENEADVLAFRAGALDQYGGELMPGCSLEWVEAERRVLEESYLTRGEKQASTLSPPDALVLLEQLRLIAPTRESLLRLHLTILCQQGNRAEAQQVYHRFRRLLLEQRLGEPSAQTQSHWQALQSLQISSPAAATVVQATSLPVPLTPCLGRRNEVEAVVRLLEKHRLVTLTGLGGIGKTRLAIETARESKQVVFLEAEKWRDAKQFAETLETLLARDGDKETLLLVIDNFEHLVGAEANRILRAQLEKHTELRCLVTSRRALGMTGEQLFPVEPLELPRYPGSPTRLGEFASIQLLVDRIRSLNPRFELTPQNTPALVALCQQSEGIPLALELLAAHLRSLSPDVLLAQVQQARLPFLARRDPGETPRHQSLWRIIESSLSFLSEAQRIGFWQLGVFRGGWSLEAAQAVCAPSDMLSIVSLLETLTDNSLIRFAGGRYSQLETLRDFSLATQPESVRAEAKRAHAAFFLAFAERYANEPEGLPLFDQEQGNLRVAFDTFLAGNDTASALRWIRALRLYWYHRWGGQALLENLLDRLDNRAERAEVQEYLGVICAMNGAYEAAQSHFNDALLHFRSVGDSLIQAKILSNLAGIAIEQGNLEQAYVELNQALPLWRQLNQPRGLGTILINLSIVTMNQGDLDTAESLIDEALTLRIQQGDSYGIAAVLVNRGSLELRRGANPRAETTYYEALDRFQKIGDRRGEAVALEGLVEALLNQERPAEALRFFQEVVWLRQEYKLPETALQTQLHARIRQALGAAIYDDVISTTYAMRNE